MTKMTIKTDKTTYTKYCAAQYWQPIGDVKCLRGCVGVVNANVRMKNRTMQPATIYIEDYFMQAAFELFKNR